MLPPTVRGALADALALVLPVSCAGCGAHDRALCESCGSQLEPRVVERRLSDGLRVCSGLTYEGVVRQVVLALKEQQRTDLARSLAPALRGAVAAAAADVPDGERVRLVAVPGSRVAYRRRGYDPVRLLLARAGFDVLRAFASARPQAAQKALGVEGRETNLSGAFRLRLPVRGSRLLLVDDIVTTGSTLAEASRVLRAGGAEVIAAATVASTPKLHAGSDDLHSYRSVTSQEGRTSVAEKARNSTA